MTKKDFKGWKEKLLYQVHRSSSGVFTEEAKNCNGPRGLRNKIHRDGMWDTVVFSWRDLKKWRIGSGKI